MLSGLAMFAALLRWMSGSMDILDGRLVIISMTDARFLFSFAFLKAD